MNLDNSGTLEKKTIDGEEYYQLGSLDKQMKVHPIPDLHRGMMFFTTMNLSPVFIVEGNDPEKLERYPTTLPGGIPDRKVGEYWLLYVPSSGSEPLRWKRGDDIKRKFQTGQYKLEPTDMAKERGIDSEAWWQTLIQQEMTEYDFIDPKKPEEQDTEKLVEENSVNSDKGVLVKSSIVNKVVEVVKGVLP